MLKLRKYLTISCLFEIVIVLGIFLLATRSIGDPDFWWHLRTGQHIVNTHSIPHTDIYSHTKLGTQWIAHEWLSEVFIYKIYQATGWMGLIAAFAALITAAFWILFQRSEGRPYLAGLATLWGAIATIPFWGVRPQMFSLLLASVFLYLLDRFRDSGHSTLLWLMPPLIVLWVNLHGGYALGIALVGIVLAAEVLDAIFTTERRDASLRAIRALIPVFAACVLAAVVNPNGYRILLYPFETLSSPSQQTFIQEWASPDFHLPRMQAFAALLIGTFLLLPLSRKRTSIRDLLLLGLTGYAALHSSRHIPLFVMVAVPVIAASADALREMSGWRTAPLPVPAALPARKAVSHALIAVLLLFACGLRLVRVTRAQPSFEAQELPAAAIAYIRQQHPPGPIFNSYEWGGYFIWRLYPEYRVFIDGRADVYGDAFLKEFVNTYRGENDWRAVLRRFHVNTVILPPEAPLAVLLKEEPAWQTVFADSKAVICVRREPRLTPTDSISLAQE